ncbi:MAG: eukaryotic-like serine/threonine-protein kinase [Acidobacteriota bacterium]|nr:eukaryotic-like serine/threonine-protein kinase [Acidobacteriota bacterium]
MKECPVCRRCFPDHVNHCPDDGDVTTQSIAGEPLLEGRYQLERRIGQGGMGVVYQSRHLFLKTPLAIKVILPDLVGNDPMLVTRFRQEALAAAAIRHQNIIAVTDFGVVRGTMPFLVMEYVSGKSLHDMLLEEGALPPGRALEIMSAIGAGVAAAHRQGIIHRDLKPLNVMFQEGLPVAEAVKVLDFGLAKIKSGELLGSFVQAKTSGLMGSPFYMAPEQWGDEEPDARADIYSLGVILYQMLAGDVPFKGNNIPSIMKKHLTEAPPSFASRGVTVPTQIEAVVRHALEKEAEDRPASVDAFIGELRDAVDSLSASLSRTSLGTFDPESQRVSTHSGLTSIPPDATRLRIQSNPPNSRVYINNVSVGVTNNTGELVVPDMLRGTHRIQILHDGYAEWVQQVECSGGMCDVEARLQSLIATSVPPPSAVGQQSLSNPFAGTITGSLINEPVPQESQSAMEAKRLRQQAEALEEQARQEEEARRREQERLEQEERERLAREQAEREEQARRKAEEEEARLKAEAEARRVAEAEAQRQAEATRLRTEEEARLKAEEDARERAAAEEQRQAEEAARLKAEADERLRVEAEARQRAEAEAAQKRAGEEAARLRAEDEQRQREERARVAAQEAAERERAAREQREREEAARRAASESAQQSPPLNLESTQSVRQGIITQPVDESAAKDEEPTVVWEQGRRSARPGQSSARQHPPFDSASANVDGDAQKKARVSTMLIAALVGVVLIAGGLGVWYMLAARSNKGNKKLQTPSPTTSATTTPVQPTPSSTPPVVIKPELIPIPGGTLEMGRDDGTAAEGPAHLVVVKSFSMDKTEVTNAEYAVFVRETNHPAPSHWGGKTPPEGKELLPVVNVSYEDAVEFAKWRSKRDSVKYRLPTEEEWEYAARGGDQGNLYPWGNTWVKGRASTRYLDLNAGGTDPEPVGSHPEDKTRWGVLDMEGNVSEWTSSKASFYKGNPMQVEERAKNWIVLRGASYATVDKKKLPLTYRDWFEPTFKYESFGFRLVRQGS